MTNRIPFVLALASAFAATGASRASGQTATEVILHNFGRLEGAQPNSPPVLDSAGNLYGATQLGGPHYIGAVYALDSAGQYRVLHSFTGGTDGSALNGVILDSAGNLYGTAADGGSPSCLVSGCGLIYRLDPAGRYSVLYNFKDVPDGAYPNSALVRDAAGNFYGTTSEGGDDSFCTAGCGVVFKLDTAGHESVLLRFNDGPNGYGPKGVAVDSAGNILGVTAFGGSNLGGVLFKLDPSGKETVLHSFTGGADGGTPSGIILDADGSLYGTTEYGGANKNGVVYRFDAVGHYTVLYSFPGGASGGNPLAGVIRGAAGEIYGTTASGGDLSACGGGCGVVFKLGPNGHETVLHTFDITDGWDPVGIARDASGNLYGATLLGGARDGGALFKLDPSGNEKVLFSFPSGNFGFYPSSGVIRDAAGNLYGTTIYGGPGGAGVVYRLSAATSYTVLYGFTNGTDGGGPDGGVISDSAGNLFGTASSGGAAGRGVVYELEPSGLERVLYSFTGGADGGTPTTGLAMDAAGNFYGTASEGGAFGGRCAQGCGVVYKLSPDGHQTVLHAFAGGADGASPSSGVIRDAAGNLYGAAYGGGAFNLGVLYKIDSAGNYTVIYSFAGGADGVGPAGNIVRDEAGSIYGAAGGGVTSGTCGCGVVYKIDPSGNETVLYAFTGGADGNQPVGGVIRDSAGNLYGDTFQGGIGDGSYGSGVVYKLDDAGNFSVVYSFNCGTDTGCFPQAGLMRDAAGHLFGTTYQGGSRGTGVVFKITP
jgi:uncharacterized repeat protein (TIGR03803 family)